MWWVVDQRSQRCAHHPDARGQTQRCVRYCAADAFDERRRVGCGEGLGDQELGVGECARIGSRRMFSRSLPAATRARWPAAMPPVPREGKTVEVDHGDDEVSVIVATARTPIA